MVSEWVPGDFVVVWLLSEGALFLMLMAGELMLTWGRGSVLFESSNPLDAMSVSEPITDIKHQWVSVGIINISVTWVFLSRYLVVICTRLFHRKWLLAYLYVIKVTPSFLLLHGRKLTLFWMKYTRTFYGVVVVCRVSLNYISHPSFASTNGMLHRDLRYDIHCWR